MELTECSWHWTDTDGLNPIPGWTVTNESVARFRINATNEDCNESWRSFSGRYSLDLDGLNPGTISTIVETDPGSRYVLTFHLTGNCDVNPDFRAVDVSIGSATDAFIHDCEFDGEESWTQHVVEFQATDPTTTITFASRSQSGERNGPVLDLISVVDLGIVDCNGNQIDDSEDIAEGTSIDCNSNGIPDECESLPDCDDDGTSDLCEILNGADDLNPADGIPDDCQGPGRGACCYNGGCILSTFNDCYLANGSFAGVGVTCEEANCPASCPGDVNGDNQIGIVDLLTIIDGWGLCP